MNKIDAGKGRRRQDDPVLFAGLPVRKPVTTSWPWAADPPPSRERLGLSARAGRRHPPISEMGELIYERTGAAGHVRQLLRSIPR